MAESETVYVTPGLEDAAGSPLLRRVIGSSWLFRLPFQEKVLNELRERFLLAASDFRFVQSVENLRFRPRLTGLVVPV